MVEAKVNHETQFYRIKGEVGVPPNPSPITFESRFVKFMNPAPSMTKYSYLTLSGPAFTVVRQARGGLRGPDEKNQG